jgi:mannose-1-phosphate guanylyltransferase
VTKKGTTSLPKPKALPKVVILVGGPGTRLHPLTHDTPKSMVPVLNKPFMEYTIAYLKQFGIKDIILALNYLPQTIQNYFGDGKKFGVRLAYCVEKSPMGTAGAVKNAEQYLNSTFIVLNGDIFTDLDIADMLAFHQNKGAKATISLNWVDNPSAFGVVETDSDQRVKQFIEKPNPGEAITNWINAGTYILEPDVLGHVPVNSHYMFEKGLFPLLLELGEPVYGYLSLNCDLLLSNTISPLIHEPDRDRIYCDRGVIIHPSAEIVGPVVIGSKSKISQGVHIKGPVVIGPDCQLEEGVSIENAVLWNNVHIGANARLRQCITSSDISIEPNNQIVNCVVTSSQTALLSQQSETDSKPSH